MDDQQDASTYNVYYSGTSITIQNTSAADIIVRATFFGE
jgi:hypothetical protein